MIDLISTEYTEEDLSYIKLGPKCGVGGPGRVVSKPAWEEDSYWQLLNKLIKLNWG